MLGITGSIAAYKTADLIRRLRALRDPRHPDGAWRCALSSLPTARSSSRR